MNLSRKEIVIDMGLREQAEELKKPLGNPGFIAKTLIGEQPSDILTFFERAKLFCYKKGFESEIESVRRRDFSIIDAEQFFLDYVYVVLNTGMSNRGAESMYVDFLQSKCNPEVIKHSGKRKAIQTGLREYKNWYSKLKELKSNPATKDEEILDYLETLPFIGDVTKKHLARNTGLLMSVAKDDRHLVRLAWRFQFKSVQEMCEYISKYTGEKVGVIDVILWRAIEQGMT